MNDFELLLVDGSGFSSDLLGRTCSDKGWKYLSCTTAESFGATYNRGITHSTGTHVVLVASDIFVCGGWDVALISELSRTGAAVAMPFLSNSDYPSQVRDQVLRTYTFCPSGMTFNLNLITRSCLDAVGLVDDQFSGCFSDLDYLLRLDRLGYRCIVADAGNIVHLGRATLAVASSVNFRKDLERFNEKHPHNRFSRGLGVGLLDFSPSKLFRFMQRSALMFPDRRVKDSVWALCTLWEPILCRV